MKRWFFSILALWLLPGNVLSAIEPLFRTVDLNVGETTRATLPDGQSVSITLEHLRETTGEVWGQVDQAEVTVVVDGDEADLISGMYRLPKTIGDFQVDCPITGGLRRSSHIDHWALEKDARLRIWPAESPWIRPDSFVYPVEQSWFASQTSFSNEPVAARPDRKLYYHAGLDIGGCEGLTEVVAATDAIIVSHGTNVHADHADNTPVAPRYDVLYLVDQRGWYYRYSHFHSFDEGLRLGQIVKKGDRLGLIGKEGGSGGWTHLHFEIKSRQPSGRWGTQDGYAFLWQSYLRQYEPDVLAVARPGHVIFAGQSVELDGTRSWAGAGKIERFHWKFSDGRTSEESRVKRTYTKPGTYFETLKVTDGSDNSDFDFVRVKVYDPSAPQKAPPRLHLAYAPTTGIHPGTEITFKARAFYFTHGQEVWNFGDGSPTVTTKSDGNVNQHAKDGYAVVKHRYRAPGDYLVHVRRVDKDGRPSEDRLHVRVTGSTE